MKEILATSIVFFLTNIFGQAPYEYPSVIDSIIIQKRSCEEVIVVQNNLGYRKEFWFDEKGKRKFDVVEFYDWPASTMIKDSCFYFNDSIVYHTYWEDVLQYKGTTYINPADTNNKTSFFIIDEFKADHVWKNKTDKTKKYRSNSKILKQNNKYYYQENLYDYPNLNLKVRNKIIILDTLNSIFLIDTISTWYENYKLEFKRKKITKINFSNYSYEDKNEQKIIQEAISCDSFWQSFDVYYCKSKKKIPKRKKVKDKNRDIYQDIILK